MRVLLQVTRSSTTRSYLSCGRRWQGVASRTSAPFLGLVGCAMGLIQGFNGTSFMGSGSIWNCTTAVGVMEPVERATQGRVDSWMTLARLRWGNLRESLRYI